MLIFFDTEFTELGADPRLISIGLVAEDGDRTFYAELSDTYEPDDCGDFAIQEVLPKLEAGATLTTFCELGERLASWLEAFGEPVTLTTDSLAWDWPWIHEVFGELGTWPDNLDHQPEILRQETEFNLAVERAFAGGLRRHHALDDAKANRLGWLAMNGTAKESQSSGCRRESAC